MLIFASVTDFFLDPIVNAGTDFIGTTGLPAVFILMLLESACLPVPSEAIMLFAGSSVAAGDLTLFGVVAAGVLGNLVGSWIAYAVVVIAVAGIAYWLVRRRRGGGGGGEPKPDATPEPAGSGVDA